MKYYKHITILLLLVCCSQNDIKIENKLLGDWINITTDTIHLTDTLIGKIDTAIITFNETQMIIKDRFYYYPIDSLKPLPEYFTHFFNLPQSGFKYEILGDNLINLKTYTYPDTGSGYLISQSIYQYILNNDSLKFNYVDLDSIPIIGTDSLLINTYIKRQDSLTSR
jgi:hypothetical protein